MEITEKVAYLKGLAEGLNLDTEQKEGKLFAAIIDILDDMALEIEDLKDDQMELGDGLDAVSDDLEDVEDLVYDDQNDLYDEDDEELFDEDEDCYGTTCPNCGEDIFFDESILGDGKVACPNCGETLEFDFGQEVEETDDEDDAEDEVEQ